jgi:hypothetical protein
MNIYVDGSSVCSGTSDVSGDFSCSYTPTQAGHQYSWYATAAYSGYNAGQSAIWTFTYQSSVVEVPLRSAISGAFSSSTTLGFEETGNVFDNAGAGYAIGHSSRGKVVFVFTDSTRVNQATGELLFSPDYSNAVVLAGPLANPTTAYYETHGLAPLTFSSSGGNAIFMQGGSTVFSVSMASLSSTNDYFIMEAFQDGGHTVIVLYGIGAPGTLASGVYFDNFVFTDLANYSAGAYIVHWEGATPNVPLPTDTYKIVYQN